jgi:hypothetical protein
MRERLPAPQLLVVAMSLNLALTGNALADGSHHPAVGPGAPAALAGVVADGPGDAVAPWRVAFIPTSLWAWRTYDDAGKAGRLPSVGRVENDLLDIYLGRRLSGSWDASVLARLQHLRAGVGPGSQTTSGLGDTVVTLRRFERVGSGFLTLHGSARIPGTYGAETMATSKQLDLEAGASISLQEILPRLGASAGLAYRLRAGGVQDELALAATLPVRMTASLDALASLSVGFPVGLGSTARNAAVAGGAIRWRSRPGVDVLASYGKTVYGRNVVAAEVASAGLAMTF